MIYNDNKVQHYSSQQDKSMWSIQNGVYAQKFQLMLIIFLGVGLALSFSVSYSFSIQNGRNVGGAYDYPTVGILTLFSKQLVAAILGIIGLIWIQKISTKKIKNSIPFVSVMALLAMVYTYFFAPEINGVKRWIRVAGVSIQTGDFVRIVLILYMAYLLSQYNTIVHTMGTIQRSRSTRKLFLLFMYAIVMYGGGLYLQGDFSSLLIFFSIVSALIFVSDIHKRWKVSILLGIIILFIILVFNDKTRSLRIFSYFNPNSDAQGINFQVEQSYDLIRKGGILGNGLGSSMLDVLILPYFNNDFVFSIILHEFGILGVGIVIGLYLMLCYYCLKICIILFECNRFYYYVSIGCLFNLVISALGHIMVVLGFVPTAGLNLPFFSSGGTSLITTLVTYAFLLKAAKISDSSTSTLQENTAP